MRPRWRLVLWGALAALLVAPAAAMRVTDEVAWTASDFVFAGVLLFGAGAAFELAVRLTARPAHRILIGAALTGVVLLTWAQGAVGLWD